MEPTHIDLVGDFLAVKWNDDQESVIGLERLRRACPCANCAGESDLTGRVHRPGAQAPLSAQSFLVLSISRIGNYAIGIHWADGHQTGIHTWTQLRQLGELDAAADGEGTTG